MQIVLVEQRVMHAVAEAEQRRPVSVDLSAHGAVPAAQVPVPAACVAVLAVPVAEQDTTTSPPANPAKPQPFHCNWKSRNKPCCTLANPGEIPFAQFQRSGAYVAAFLLKNER